MSDDMTVPHTVLGSGSARSSFTHSYRARRAGMDSSTRLLFMAASGLGLVLLVGMGVWTFSGHRAAGIPVIEADSRPLRIKPENPGGMTVTGANEQVMGGHGDETGDLAPEAERPDPQALRAQRQATSPPATAVPPAAAPAPAASAPAAPPATPSPAAVSGPIVQVAALESEAAATAEWQRLSKLAPDLFGDRKPNVLRADRDGKTFWRLRTGGFADTASAAAFCRKLRAKNLGCSITS